MSFDLTAEVERAKFLDWIENNQKDILAFLLLEHEEILREMYEDRENIK